MRSLSWFMSLKCPGSVWVSWSAVTLYFSWSSSAPMSAPPIAGTPWSRTLEVVLTDLSSPLAVSAPHWSNHNVVPNHLPQQLCPTQPGQALCTLVLCLTLPPPQPQSIPRLTWWILGPQAASGTGFSCDMWQVGAWHSGAGPGPGPLDVFWATLPVFASLPAARVDVFRVVFTQHCYQGWALV